MIPRRAIYSTVAAGASFGAVLLMVAAALISTGTIGGGVVALIFGLLGIACIGGAVTIAIEHRAVESRRPMAIRNGEGER